MATVTEPVGVPVAGPGTSAPFGIVVAAQIAAPAASPSSPSMRLNAFEIPTSQRTVMANESANGR